jgi:hypothetical protein
MVWLPRLSLHPRQKLAHDSKKLASKGLKEKKQQLLTSHKAKRDAINAAALQKKAFASILSTPGSDLPELSGIHLHFPKKSILAANPLTPSSGTALAHSTLSPQRKGDSPKKRAQLNQAPTSTPPHEYQATPASYTSGSWSGSDDESEEDFSAKTRIQLSSELSSIPLIMLCNGWLRHWYFGRQGYSWKNIVALCGCSVREWKRKTKIMSAPQFHLDAWVSHRPSL